MSSRRIGPYPRKVPTRLLALIHPSAWNRNSRKFAVASYSSPRIRPLDNRPWCSPPAPKRPDLVAVVAPMCIKGLRLVTVQLPEKFSPVGLGTNRSSHIRISAKFVLTAHRKGRCSSYAPHWRGLTRLSTLQSPAPSVPSGETRRTCLPERQRR